nr:putative integron gene cassette protein [uncultured bacterium]
MRTLAHHHRDLRLSREAVVEPSPVAFGWRLYVLTQPIRYLLADLPLRELSGSDAQPLVRRHLNLSAPQDYAYTAQTWFGFGWRQRHLTAWHLEEAKSFSSPSNEREVAVICAGWPCLSLEGERHFEPQPVTYRFAWLVQESSVREWRFVPLLPIRPGFAVNTLFYAAVFWLPFVVRRWLRARRGLCHRCAFPMGESAVCTECGKALPHRSVG